MAGLELSEQTNRMLENIAQHGWHAMHVFDPELITPNFTYTVGFSQTLNAPEFIIFGLHRDVMNEMLWHVYDSLKAGLKVEPDQVWEDLSDDYTLIGKKAVHEDLFTKYATLADAHWQMQNKSGHPGMVQLVWPGLVDGLYPWDAGCSARVIEAQPRLWA